jgi:glucosamine--fructose-6-phosphate aminotransferase (isomerizing)
VTSVVRGPYLEDLLQQPAAVEATLAALAPDDALRAVAGRSFDRIVLTGMGSSLSALQPLALRLAARGRTAMLLDASELVHGMQALLTAGTLVVAVSQSGRSAEIVRLAERSTRDFALVAVTNTPGSPLAAAADAAVLTQAGAETTVSCKTYVAALAALTMLGDVLCEERELDALASAREAMSRYLDRWQGHVAELAALTEGVRDVFFAGRGSSLAAAYTAGLIVKESTRIHAEGMTSAALRHGPMEMAASHVLAVVYEGDASVAPLNRTLALDLARAGARAEVCGTSATIEALRLPAVPSALRDILEILPAQMLSLTLAAHAGIEAGRFLHASKITATE